MTLICGYYIFYFVFTEAPVLVRAPDDLTLNEGDTARLTCEISGSPQPNITWYKGSKYL